MKVKLYTLDGQFIKEDHDYLSTSWRGSTTGIVEFENENGQKERRYYKNGNYYRKNGPAVEYTSGYCSNWFVNGKSVSQKQYQLFADALKLKGLL